MLRAFSTAATGMSAQQLLVDVTANNLANINTNGFKRSQVDFQDLMYVKMLEANRQVAQGMNAPTGFEVGNGVRPASTLRVQEQGQFTNTGRDLDLAIEGEGYLQVSLPSGEIRYTRDGSLRTNANGELVTASGYYIEPRITFPPDTQSISIGADGTVVVMTGGSDTPQALGQLELARFPNETGLSAEGRNLLAQTAASGEPETGVAGTNGLGTIQQSFLEKANVQMVTELVNLITAQRAYEINGRVIKAGDGMLTTANRLLGG
jgi:flagellar basal-body rod protein FlgG